MEFILSQIFGGVALVLVCVSYFMRDKSKFLIIQIFADIFYAAAYLVVGLWVAGAVTVVSAFRCLFLFFDEKYKWKHSAIYLILFILGYIVVGVLLWSSWLDIIPMITATLFSIAFFVKNMQLVRGLCLVPNIMLVVYNIVCKTFTSSILDMIETIVLISSFVKFYVEEKRAKRNYDSEVFKVE